MTDDQPSDENTPDNYSPTNEIDWSQEVDKEGEDENPPNPKKRGLGRGLDSLFGDDGSDDSDQPAPQAGQSIDYNTGGDEDDEVAGLQRKNLGIDQLEPNPDQPRRSFDQESLRELADSIARYGLLQPILVRPKFDGDDGYEIIAGERRWRACQIAQIHTVPVIIHDLGDEQTLEIALIENLQREDLNAIDEAIGYQRLMDEFDKTQAELAEAMGKSRSHIANMLRLNSLPEGVQALVRDGKLSAGHARTLVNADDPADMAKKIMDGNLSVRAAEKLATQSGASKPQKKKASSNKKDVPDASNSNAPVQKDADTRALEEEISNMLGMKIDIQMYEKNGKLTVTFDDLDQLDDLLHRLTHGAPKQGFGY